MKRIFCFILFLLIIILIVSCTTITVPRSTANYVTASYATYTTSKYTPRPTDPPSNGYNDLDVEFLDSDWDYGYITLTFKVKNNGKRSYSYIKVKVSLLDSDNNVLTSDWTYAVGSEGLDRGDSQEFDVMIKKPKSGSVDRYSWEIIDFD